MEKIASIAKRLAQAQGSDSITLVSTEEEVLLPYVELNEIFVKSIDNIKARLRKQMRRNLILEFDVDSLNEGEILACQLLYVDGRTKDWFETPEHFSKDALYGGRQKLEFRFKPDTPENIKAHREEFERILAEYITPSSTQEWRSTHINFSHWVKDGRKFVNVFDTLGSHISDGIKIVRMLSDEVMHTPLYWQDCFFGTSKGHSFRFAGHGETSRIEARKMGNSSDSLEYYFNLLPQVCSHYTSYPEVDSKDFLVENGYYKATSLASSVFALLLHGCPIDRDGYLITDTKYIRGTYDSLAEITGIPADNPAYVVAIIEKILHATRIQKNPRKIIFPVIVQGGSNDKTIETYENPGNQRVVLKLNDDRINAEVINTLLSDIRLSAVRDVISYAPLFIPPECYKISGNRYHPEVTLDIEKLRNLDKMTDKKCKIIIIDILEELRHSNKNRIASFELGDDGVFRFGLDQKQNSTLQSEQFPLNFKSLSEIENFIMEFRTLKLTGPEAERVLQYCVPPVSMRDAVYSDTPATRLSEATTRPLVHRPRPAPTHP